MSCLNNPLHAIDHHHPTYTKSVQRMQFLKPLPILTRNKSATPMNDLYQCLRRVTYQQNIMLGNNISAVSNPQFYLKFSSNYQCLVSFTQILPFNITAKVLDEHIHIYSPFCQNTKSRGNFNHSIRKTFLWEAQPSMI